MKLLITGSRRATEADFGRLAAAIDKYAPGVGEILHGGAEGADQLAGRYARERGLKETVLRPDYTRHPAKLAPLVRNQELVQRADGVIALYCGAQGGGTAYTAGLAAKAGKLLAELHDGGEREAAAQLTLF